MNMVIKNDRILEAALAVLVKRPNATLQTIANAAGVSRTTIFNRYPTREDLVEALAIDALQRIGQVMKHIPLDHTDDFPAVLLDITKGLMPLGPYSTFLRNAPGMGESLDSHWEDAVTPLFIYFMSAQSHGQLHADFSHRWLVYSYLSLLFSAWEEIAGGELGHIQAARLVVVTWLSGTVNRPLQD